MSASSKYSQSSASLSAQERVGRPLRILVADDEKDAVLTLRALLMDDGHDVVALHSAVAVISDLRKQIADAVVVDIQMPRVSGFEVAREAKRIYGDWAPLLIAISGVWTGQTDGMLAKIAGFDHFLKKPCNIALLRELLEPLRHQPPKPRSPFLDQTVGGK